MADISKIEVNGTEYDVSDATERVQALKSLTSTQFNKLLTFLQGPTTTTIYADEFDSQLTSDETYSHKSRRQLEIGVYLVTFYDNLSYKTVGQTSILKIENTYNGNEGQCDIAGFTLYYSNARAGEDYYMSCNTSSIWSSDNGFIFQKLTI